MKGFLAALTAIALVFSLATVGFADGFVPAGRDETTDPSDDTQVDTAPETSPEASFQPPANGYANTTAYLRVGLFYSSTALPSANLANEVGSGYQFGWFDKNGVFTGVGYTDREKITVLKDRNMYVANGVYYDGLPPAGASTIGAFHAQPAEVYATFDEAVAAAQSIGDNAFAAYVNGEYRVRVGNYKSESDVPLDSATTSVGNSATCYTVTVTATGEILFEFDAGDGNHLGIRPMGADKTETWFKQYRYNGGFEYRRSGGGDITVVNVVSLGDYTRGVIPYESGPSWHIESLKVAALCASSYALFSASRSSHAAAGFDVCNKIDCQVYNGLNRATDHTNAACDAVAGYAIYYDGKVCNTVYHSSNGGSTESALNVWGTDYPYLQAVADDKEPLGDLAHGYWTTSYTGEEISWILTQKNYPIGTVTKAYVEEYTDAGNVYRLSFEDAAGVKRSFTMERCRSILGSDTLKKYTHSQRFRITSGSGIDLVVGENKVTVNTLAGLKVASADGVKSLPDPNEVYVITANGTDKLTGGKGDGVFTVSGSGWGHNVGLSQYGAKVRAEEGWTYEQIIKYYYTGVEILPVGILGS